MSNDVTNPHDAFFKQYLSQPNVAVDFLRQHLPVEVTELLDLSQLRLEKDSFIDEKLRGYFSDLIYSTVTNYQTNLRVAFLCEHKSYPDGWVDFQAMRYQVGYWVQEFDRIHAEQTLSEGRAKRKPTLTPILVLLVYHGKEEWNIELRFARHFSGMEEPNSPLSKVLSRYIPDFEPHFVNLSTIADEAIQGEMVTQLFVMVLKHIFDPGLGGNLDKVLKLASEIIRQPSGMEMVMGLLRYIGRSAVKIDKAEMTQKLIAYLPKEGGILMETMAQEWIEEGKKEGKKEGIDIGKKEGIDIGKEAARRQIVHAMAHNGFDEASIARLLTLSQDDVVRLLNEPSEEG